MCRRACRQHAETGPDPPLLIDDLKRTSAKHGRDAFRREDRVMRVSVNIESTRFNPVSTTKHRCVCIALLPCEPLGPATVEVADEHCGAIR